MEKLFVYGNLIDKQIQKKVFGRMEIESKDTLDGYTTSKIVVDGLICQILTTNHRESVDGSLLLVTKEELKQIDEYETKAYKRIKVNLKSGKKAWVYAK